MNTELTQNDKQRGSDMQPSDIKIQSTFYYQIANMKAMKIIVLIKISKLKFDLEQMFDNSEPFYLKTEKGQMHKEYEIINFIINQSKQNQKNERNAKVANGLKESIRSHDSQSESFIENNQNQQNQAVNLCGDDNYLYSKMMETLFELRCNLFPLLDEFYKYLLGHERIKKIKYQSLINKIKSQIAKLDTHINQHSDIYSYQNSFLNIIIACELFMGCKFVFEQKFRKSKYSLFTKYEKVSKKPQFQQIYGKTTPCLKQYVPPQFQIEEQSPTQQANKKSDEVIPQQIMKLSENILAPPSYQSDRNELLYYYFRSVFTQYEHKKNYFPYFWLMFDCLNCTLVEIVYENSANSGLEELNSKLKMLQFELQKYLKITSIDYGLVGVYQHEHDKHYIVRGILCLGSKNFNDLKYDMESSVELREWKICKIDINQQSQKRQVQNIWENTVENDKYQGIITCSILYI